MSHEYIIGKATEQDIYSHLMKCNNDFIIYLEDRINIREYSKKISEHAITFEAWSEDTLVGLVAAYFNDSRGQAGYISNVSTIDTYTGKGIASALINLSIDYARRHEFKTISLEVEKANVFALRLYKRFQFEEVEEGLTEILMTLSV